MFIVTLRLVGPADAYIDPEKFRTLLSTHFEPADQIEHLWARSQAGRIDVAVFVLADGEADALLTSRAAYQRVASHLPILTPWRLLDT
ncbi:hypothetical protein [Streptomyces sp. G-G2]|uniref:hypothetical protein n=1 Tax=Streptomyces sp. G-G2 TaxID=3046201 RepID=UPI0024B9C76A|nr:hypothetical protein [Streptomyces sp. G-G2]MDJ0386274.1 hypothetical protein [Streptomyces sp. G-G2]